MLNSKLAKKVLKERESLKPLNMFDGSFSAQEDFIKNPAKLKALLATRRFGKSYTSGLYLCSTAIDNPGTTLIYVGLTEDSARKIMIKDVLKVINRKFNLRAKFKSKPLSMTFPNGSVIYLMGVDSDEDDKDKLLGQKYKLAIIDECASYRIDLHELVYKILKPAMADLGGTICMIGTPGNLTKSLFFDVTTGKEPGWYVMKGNTADNPHMKAQWETEIKELTTSQPYITETPAFKQMYLGQWVIDEDALVYKYNEERNTVKNLPMYSSGQWQYLMGVDLGYEDDSAFTVVGYHEHDRCLYVVETYSRSKMDITDVANKIKELQKKWGAWKVVIDGANKQAVEEIQKRHGVPLITAEKQGKSDFIEIMNADLIQGFIKVLVPNCYNITDEWKQLVWKEKGTKREENPSCPNHLADSCLYIWRYCYAYLSQAPKSELKPGSKEYYTREVEQMEEAAEEYFTKLEQQASDEEDWL